MLETKNNFQTLFQTYLIITTLCAFNGGFNTVLQSSDLLRLTDFQGGLRLLIAGATFCGYFLYANKLYLSDHALKSPDQRLKLENKIISPKSLIYFPESTKNFYEILVLYFPALVSEVLYITLLASILSTSAFAGYNAIIDRESDEDSNNSIPNFTETLENEDFTPRVLAETTFPDGSFLANNIFAGNQLINFELVVPRNVYTPENINTVSFTYRAGSDQFTSLLLYQPVNGHLVNASISSNGKSTLINIYIDPNTGVYYMQNPEQDGEITVYWDGSEQRIHLPENASIGISEEQDQFVEGVLGMLGIQVEEDQDVDEIGNAMRDALYSLDFRAPSGINGAVEAVRTQVEELIATGDTDITIEELEFYCDTMAFWMQAVGAAVGDPLGVAQGGVVRNGQILNLTLHAMNFDENGFIDNTPWRIDETSEITREYLEALENADEEKKKDILEEIIFKFQNLPGAEGLVKFLIIMGVPGLLGLFAMIKYNNPKGDGVEFIVDDSIEFFERGEIPKDPEFSEKKRKVNSSGNSVQPKVQLGNLKIDEELGALIQNQYNKYRNPNGRALNNNELAMGLQTIVDTYIANSATFESFKNEFGSKSEKINWQEFEIFYNNRKIELEKNEVLYQEA